MRALLRFAVAAALVAALYLGGRALLAGSESDRRIRRLDAESRLLRIHLGILRYARERGGLPEFPEDILQLRNADPVTGAFEFHRDRGKKAVDPWSGPLRYERDPDGVAFRLLSAGPDGAFGTADDLREEGRAGEDPAPLSAALNAREEEALGLLGEKARWVRERRRYR